MAQHESTKRPSYLEATKLIPLLSGAAWLALGYPVLRWLVLQWESNDFYSHGFLVFPLAIYLAWRLWPRSVPAGERDAGLFFLLLTVIVYIWFSGQHADYLAALAWLGLGAALVWSVAGLQVLARVWFPFLFAALAVPLPFVEAASLPLSQIAGMWAARVVHLFGVPVVVSGQLVSLPSANLMVGAQCSGLRSMVALATLSVLFAFIVQGPWWGRLILVFSAFPLALVGNLARVSSLLVVADHWGADAGFRFYHDYSGYVFFLAAFILLIALARLVRCGDIRSDLF